ncbi:MYND-type zinc finger-containing chromatin reader ZMYND8-like [Paramacrobiotus metropolitanus]|uniref:MYND-type zinc finger-containing chromatin reader ZMYND8-like n=1 Tax=Paramacrobiotus metropolitanus TaxID=2943436 RepID=UPI00244579B6|nr:MYND-type zinc finger-containing chromatin reader ZMYND8-like [Paramacrobiotus metropolitanus]XP_055345644.1 MYND-type zinc finger-containing chromatin reader ZMYND8-like [Paramacrobiotus metropolitanus]
MEEGEEAPVSEHSAEASTSSTNEGPPHWESTHSITTSSDRDSPHPERRRSARLHQPGRTTPATAHSADTEDDERTASELEAGKSGTTSPASKRTTKGKLEYGMKYPLVPERQLNPDLNMLWDAFCWRCHKAIPLKEQRGCPKCVRVFHRACWWNLNPSSSRDLPMDTHPLSAPHNNPNTQSQDELAPDNKLSECLDCYCIMDESRRADSAFNRVGMTKFKSYLSHMMRFVNEHLPEDRVRPFAIPVIQQEECSDEVKEKYQELITHPMDLRQIANNIEDNKYQTCTSFLADLKWVQHNTSIFNGQNSRYTHSAHYIVETCQNLCYSLEWCMECFERGMPRPGETIQHAIERAMIQPCSDPHAVVWVKAEKYPIWPAIVYRFNGTLADVRFFGAFEFGVFPKDAIFMYTNKFSKGKQKGKVKLEYENALAQFRKHVAKLQRIPDKQLIAHPKNTPFDGRLRMFSDNDVDADIPPPLVSAEVPTVPPAVAPVVAERESLEKSFSEFPPMLQIDETPEERTDKRDRDRSKSPSTEPLSQNTGYKRIRLIEPREPSPAPETPIKETVAEIHAPEPVVASPEPGIPEPTSEVSSLFPASPELTEVINSKNRRKRQPLRVPRADEAVSNVESSVETQPSLLHNEVSSAVAGSSDNAFEPLDVAEESDRNKPAQLEADVEMEMPSFEMPEDGQDVRTRSAGKLDSIMKRPTSSPAKEATVTVPDSVRAVPKGGMPPRPMGALAHELSKATLPAQSRSVLNDAQRSQGGPQQDLLRKAARKGFPSMAAGSSQSSYLIDALQSRSSPRPLPSSAVSLGSFSDTPPTDRLSASAVSDADSVQIIPADSAAETDSRSRTSGNFGQETLGSLLAAGTPAGGTGRSDSGGIFSRMVQTTDAHAVYASHRGIDVRSQMEVRARMGNSSGTLRFTPSRNSFSEKTIRSTDNADQNVQKPILTRSLNSPTMAGIGRFATPPSSTVLNGSLARASPVPLTGLNGDRMSPALPSSNLLRSNPTWNPNTAAERTAATASGPNANRVPGQADTAQLQVELFLRNTKKNIRERKADGTQALRDMAQMHSDAYRALQESQARSQSAVDKMLQDMQETMEQNVKKFEILFAVYQSETDFAQKSKVQEVTRMKDIERQRAITAAKRTLWCCVCLKTAKLLCCGVTTYCSEECQRKNAPLHSMHCRRSAAAGALAKAEAEQEASVYTPFGPLTRCAHVSRVDSPVELEEDAALDANNGWAADGEGALVVDDSVQD